MTLGCVSLPSGCRLTGWPIIFSSMFDAIGPLRFCQTSTASWAGSIAVCWIWWARRPSEKDNCGRIAGEPAILVPVALVLLGYWKFHVCSTPTVVINSNAQISPCVLSLKTAADVGCRLHSECIWPPVGVSRGTSRVPFEPGRSFCPPVASNLPAAYWEPAEGPGWNGAFVYFAWSILKHPEA